MPDRWRPIIYFPNLKAVAINTSNDNSRFTSLDGTEKKGKGKNESMDLDARARMTLAATYTADLDESKKTHAMNNENMTSEQMKDYLADVLEEFKDIKNKHNKAEQKE